MRQSLDPVITADKCFQYVDDIGVGAHDLPDMLEKLSAVFTCIRESGMKLGTDKCAFEKNSVLGEHDNFRGFDPHQPELFSEHSRCRKMLSKQKVIGFFNFYKAFIPELEKLLPFYRLLKKETDFEINEEHNIMLNKLTQDLQSACEITLRLPMTNRQYVIMADASFYAAGFVLIIEDYTQTANGTSEHKIYAPVSFGSRIFKPNQLKMSIYTREFIAVHFALNMFANTLWGCEKPILVLTDNRAVTRFFQTKIIPPTLWNVLDHVLSFDIILGHIPGKPNLAADYLSRIHKTEGKTYTSHQLEDTNQ